jgi:hypothetical protein
MVVKLRNVVFFIVALTLLSFVLHSDEENARFDEKDTAAMIKASYIYNFAKLIDWPTIEKKGNFVIGVMGETGMYQQLVNKYNGKSIGSQPIEIRKISSSLNFTTCHVLFVDFDHSNHLTDIAKRISGTSTLLVTYNQGALSKGAAINFVLVESNLKFEVSVSNAERQNLFIGSTLKSLAINVEN